MWPSCPNARQPERHQGLNPDGLNLSRSTKGANPGSNPRRGRHRAALQALDSLALNKRNLAGSSFECPKGHLHHVLGSPRRGERAREPRGRTTSLHASSIIKLPETRN